MLFLFALDLTCLDIFLVKRQTFFNLNYQICICILIQILVLRLTITLIWLILKKLFRSSIWVSTFQANFGRVCCRRLEAFIQVRDNFVNQVRLVLKFL